MTRVVLIVCAVVLLPCLASAKRAAPAKVEPVIYQGVQFVAPNDDGRRGYIEARDDRTNKKLWELTVFTNHIDPKLEEDIQWVFIEKLSARDGTLMVTSERGKTYQIDLKTKAVTQSDPAGSPTPDAAAQLHDIPEAVERAIKKGPLVKEYDVSFHSWRVYSKDRTTRGVDETTVPRLHGEALLVGKSESASALIYWNGKRYVWLQQGD